MQYPETNPYEPPKVSGSESEAQFIPIIEDVFRYKDYCIKFIMTTTCRSILFVNETMVYNKISFKFTDIIEIEVGSDRIKIIIKSNLVWMRGYVFANGDLVCDNFLVNPIKELYRPFLSKKFAMTIVAAAALVFMVLLAGSYWG